MTQANLPRVERLNGGAPIVAKIGDHPWENKVTFNPACMLVDDREELQRIIPSLPFDAAVKRRLLEEPALCFLLYRAQGKKTVEWDHTRSTMGLAVLTAELRLLARAAEPVLRPTEAYENLGVEDGRLTRVDGTYYLTYTAYATGSPHNRVRIAVASTKNFFEWEKHGLLNADFNRIDNKNAMLFDAPVDGGLLMLHRPMQGENAMQIHWAEGGSVLGEWKTRGVLMRIRPNPEFTDTWVGGGSPPMRIGDGRFLMVYHIGNRRADATREYDLGIALLDPRGSDPVVKRDEPLLRPGTPAETTGDAELGVNDVVFICGSYFYNGDLYFPYAGADSVVLAGRITRTDIERYCV